MTLERTLRVVAEFPDRETTVPVMGQALREDAAREFALTWLLAAPENRAAREIVRSWDALPPGARRRANETAGVRLRDAARQLSRSDRAVVRRNVAELFAGHAAHLTSDLDPLLADLAPLVDDPDLRARTIARGAFLDALLREEHRLAGLTPHDPRLGTLAVLLRDWSPHRDPRVIEAMIGAGPGGHAWLERAVGEEWPAADAIVAAVSHPPDEEGASRRLALLGRWLDGPREPARRRAREILRTSEDRRLLRAAAEELDEERAQGELPTWRRMRWWHLSDADLSSLPPGSLAKIAGFLAASEGTGADRAERVARLLPLTGGAARRTVLSRLRGLPVDHVLDRLTPIISGGDPEAIVIALELLPASGAASLPWIVSQLAAEDETIRAAAARRLAGQGLRLWREGRARIPSDRHRAILSVLGKVDPTFPAQLRRALASDDVGESVEALLTVAEWEDPAPFEEALVDRVVHPDPRVRATVTRPLGQLPGPTGLHYLGLLLEDDDPRVVANAIEEIGRRSGAEGTAGLEAATGHPHPRVRTTALLALARAGDPSAGETLRTLAERGPDRTRRSAEWALGRLEEGGSG